MGLAKLGTDVERQAALQEIFGREAGSAARKLIEVGGPALSEYAKGLHNVDGVSRDLAKTLNSGINSAWEQLSGSIETAGIALGQILVPAAKAGARCVHFVGE